MGGKLQVETCYCVVGTKFSVFTLLYAGNTYVEIKIRFGVLIKCYHCNLSETISLIAKFTKAKNQQFNTHICVYECTLPVGYGTGIALFLCTE